MGSEIQSCLRLSKGVRYRTHGAQRRQGRLNKSLEVSFHEEIQFEIKSVSWYPVLQDWITVQARSKFGDDFRTQDAFWYSWGEGRILNMDESQSYRYDESSRAWTF